MIHYATQRLIDSVWTVSYRIVDEAKSEIEILSYDRDNPIGYEQEKTLNRGGLVESEGRIVTELIIEPYEPFKSWINGSGTKYTVINPKHIFDYK
jgi:hypothetical protein